MVCPFCRMNCEHFHIKEMLKSFYMHPVGKEDICKFIYFKYSQKNPFNLFSRYFFSFLIFINCIKAASIETIRT